MKTLSDNVIRRRNAHHKALETIAREVGCHKFGLKLWRELSRLERKVYAACEQYSNDGAYGTERWEADKANARLELQRIFQSQTLPVGLFINSDPRGHMLKLDCDVRPIPEGMERDWGGNGILAQQITED